MRTLWLAGLAWLWVWPAVAQAGPSGTATATVRLAGEGLHAEIVLDRAVARFAFAEAAVVREGEFELLTPGLTLKDDVVTAPAPFRRIALRIRPMTQERDAKYPAFFRIGEGGVVYAPALRADPAAWRTRLRFRTAPGHVRAPSSGKVGDGFVFLGPARLRSEDRAIVVVADPGMPAWLVERARTGLADAVAAFTAALDAPLPRKPVLILRHQDGERSFNVGDVTPGAVTSLRFHGPAWLQPDETAGRNVQAFILHEAFHFWNGGIASHAPGTPTWLHEGGAEYAALLVGHGAGVLTDAEVRRRLSEALQRCRLGLQNQGDKGLGEIGFLSNQLRYPCGMVLQWAADLHLRRTGAGARTVLDAWADTIRAAHRRPSRSYGLADFHAAAGLGDGEFEPVALLVERSGPERWQALPSALNALGAEVAQMPTAESRRAALLFHVLRQNCRDLPPGTGIGFFVDGRAVKLQSPAGCGVLAGDPPLAGIEGGDPFDMTPETYAAVQRKCAAGAGVILATADGRTLSAACAAPLPAAPEDYVVERWLPAPTP
jgi:hypothetical protein